MHYRKAQRNDLQAKDPYPGDGQPGASNQGCGKAPLHRGETQ